MRTLRIAALIGLFAFVITYHFTSQAQTPDESDAPAASVESDTTATAQVAPNPTASSVDWYPLVTLGVGIAVVLGLIIVFKVNAFIALITAAVVVSCMAPGDVSDKISRVASAFGSSAGGIGIVIAMAAVIGTCMLDSGAADRIVRAFLRLLGEKHSPVALLGSGFVLAVPVFFDTVFYLLVPLARSLHRKTGKQYLKYILAIGAGGAITHTLVPPTPGPLLMASNLGIDVGWMIMVGALVAVPAAIAGLVFAGLMDRVMKTPMRQIGNTPEPDPLKDEELPSLFLSLLPVVLPVLMISASTILTTIADNEHAARMDVSDIADADWPAWRQEVVLQFNGDADLPGKSLLNHKAITPDIRQLFAGAEPLSAEDRDALITAVNTVLGDKDFYTESAFLGIALNDSAKKMVGKRGARMKQVDAERLNRSLLESSFAGIQSHVWNTPARKASDYSKLFGNANLALLISTIIALWILAVQRNLSRTEMAKVVETSLMSGGVIILITAGGGAFGAMLAAAEVGPAIEKLFSGTGAVGGGGIGFLLLGFLIASILKIAQGSSTVAMIVGSGMVAAIIAGQDLGFHPVYLATAIGAGSLVGSWMNDSGFWIFAKMGGLTEVEALKSWTLMLIVLGFVSLAMSILLSIVLPLV